MAFQQSPGVEIIEKDASAVTTGASSTVGGAVGVFQWGPIMTPMLISNENSLVSTFGKPDNNTFSSFFAVANFLNYTSACYVTRAATANLNGTSDGTGLLIGNIDIYDASYSAGQASVGTFASRYPGVLGNGLIVSVADSASFTTWTYKALFTAPPGTSDYAASKGGSLDELHIIVIDGAGKFSGVPGSTLEKFAFVSKGVDAVSVQGLSNYYVNVLRNQSSYVYSMLAPVGGTNWGTSVISTTFTTLTVSGSQGYNFTYTMAGGTDSNTPADSVLEAAWDLYKAVETYDISLFFVGNASTTLSAYVKDNIGEIRKDCVVFVSLVASSGGPVFGNSTTRLTDAATFKTAMGNSTYTVIDSGFKYMYDKYNDKFRWIALNSDTAGLCARVDSTQDTWFSPAGYTKGQIKGAIKLAWNPNKSERDELYKIAINPIVSFKGDGTMLFGDKTATLKPSSFDRINVRRLFLILEKSISRSAKYQLFDQNDAISRLQFVASVEPFLRDVQGRRGIDKFRVICDESNNTPQVISTNTFRGTILVRPIYSINFI
jgi:hypothetical protein